MRSDRAMRVEPIQSRSVEETVRLPPTEDGRAATARPAAGAMLMNIQPAATSATQRRALRTLSSIKKCMRPHDAGGTCRQRRRRGTAGRAP